MLVRPDKRHRTLQQHPAPEPRASSAQNRKCRYRHACVKWTCTECGTIHDRDVNAAKNILKFSTAGIDGNSSAWSGQELERSCIAHLR
ncbi:MAG: hypothetical protein EKK69_09655 [Candidatus Competibacteraceae bacterium]|nr:MAG: hypothetical protein EKK69_09655 [Candidatus Competibacteraceae bacterium]